jgi:hypothetical protein
MYRTFVLVAAVALIAGSASAQTIDSRGRCHSARGRYAPASVCRRGVAATRGGYKLDARGKCRDARGRLVSAAMCKP